MHLQLHIFRLKYSFERICPAIVHITTIQCALHCKLVAKYSAHPPIYAIWTVVTAISKVPTAPHIKALIFNCRQLPCYWRYLDNSMRVILHSCCQVQRTSSNLCYVNCGSGHIQCNYSTAYLGFNNRLNLSALLLEIIGHVNARYAANLVPNTAHILRYTLCELWSRTYTMHLQHRIFSLQYSSQRICAAIVDNTSIQCALYCKLWAKYGARPPVYAMWTVVPAITKYLQLRIFMLQYSAVGGSPAIGGISTIQCALYCILGAKFSAHPPVYVMWPVVPAIYKVFSAPHI
jgi:hypothetical protein